MAVQDDREAYNLEASVLVSAELEVVMEVVMALVVLYGALTECNTCLLRATGTDGQVWRPHRERLHHMHGQE